MSNQTKRQLLALATEVGAGGLQDTDSLGAEEGGMEGFRNALWYGS